MQQGGEFIRRYQARTKALKCNNRMLLKMILILISGLSYLLLLRSGYLHFGVPCLFHKVTGLWCTGCGVTRMVIRLSKLDFIGAFRSNEFVFITLPAILWVWFYEGSKFRKVRNVLTWVLLIAALAFGVLRNIFPILAPI